LTKERRVNLYLKNKRRRFSSKGYQKGREKLLRGARKKIGQAKIQEHGRPFTNWI